MSVKIRLVHQQCLTGALDFAGDFPVVVRWHPCEAAGQNLAILSDESLEEVGVLPVDGLEGDVHAAARHRAVGTAEGGAAGGCFWLHIRFRWVDESLLCFLVHGAAAKERVVFHLLQAIGGVRALFVARRDVTGDGFAFRACLGALKNDEVACHKCFSKLG
jgi:hypothetical protein